MQAKCTLAAKHKWEWVKDITASITLVNTRSTVKSISRACVYKCQCGMERVGVAKVVIAKFTNHILAHDSAQACALLLIIYGGIGIAELFCKLTGA